MFFTSYPNHSDVEYKMIQIYIPSVVEFVFLGSTDQNLLTLGVWDQSKRHDPPTQEVNASYTKNIRGQ